MHSVECKYFEEKIFYKATEEEVCKFFVHSFLNFLQLLLHLFAIVGRFVEFLASTISYYSLPFHFRINPFPRICVFFLVSIYYLLNIFSFQFFRNYICTSTASLLNVSDNLLYIAVYVLILLIIIYNIYITYRCVFLLTYKENC